MEKQELISKKELLELMGISYGQLYRWKRKQLIPEDWFIRKSTFTGQESFFPRELIVPRIEKILQMKDDLSLDELAEKLTPFTTDVVMPKSDLPKRNIVSQETMEHYTGGDSDTTLYTFEQLLFLRAVDRLLIQGEVTVDEGRLVLKTLQEQAVQFEGGRCEIVLFRKMGVSLCLLVAEGSAWAVDGGTRAMVRLPLALCMEDLLRRL